MQAQQTNPVTLERFPAAPDSDTATKQTVELMCRYIAESCADPLMQEIADYIRANYCPTQDPAMLAWGVFWFAKHNLKFVVDESPMLRLANASGLGFTIGSQDLLYAPNVLMRIDPRDRKGDCDDFTMLVCCLLKCLGVPFVIVTVAAGRDDPSRWSHVFCMAMLPSGPLALDASHGNGPGWMVPKEHTFRWQAWDESGNQVDVLRPGSNQLHGWVQTGGLGQTDTVDFPDVSLPTDYTQITGAPPITTDILNANPTGITSSGSSFNWTSLLNNLTTQAAGVARTAELTGAQQNAALNQSNLFGSLLPIILVVIVGGVAISALKK